MQTTSMHVYSEQNIMEEVGSLVKGHTLESL